MAPPKVRPRLYREFLTPTLHLRFTHAAGAVLLVLYTESVLIGFLIGSNSSLLWLWLPAILRALSLSISALVIFILRVAQLRVGPRTTPSPFDTFKQALLQWNTYRTFAFYLFSAWWFSEIYLWSASTEADLSLIAEGKTYERQRLNERPIYLRSHLYFLAVAESILHLYFDHDLASPPLPTLEGQGAALRGTQEAIAPGPYLRQNLVHTMIVVCKQTLILCLSSLVLYASFFRGTAWRWGLSVARIIWSVPRTAGPPTLPPYHLKLIWQSLSSGFLLLTLWRLSNLLFTIYVAQRPLKKGKPLTQQSPDPNGTLLNGLRSKKDLVRSFAFWELFCISTEFEERRLSIYSELDREGGSTWTQILDLCLATVENINMRITSPEAVPGDLTIIKNQELPANPVMLNSAVATAIPDYKKVHTLPRLSEPIRETPIFADTPKPTRRRDKFSSAVGEFAKSYGQSPPADGPGSARKYLDAARDKMLTTEQQKLISPDNVPVILRDVLTRFIATTPGVVFRHPFDRRVNAKIFGSPRSDIGAIVDAIDGITFLTLASIKEDEYGTVYKDVPRILRTFTNVITMMESFIRDSGIHWTDLDLQVAGAATKRVSEVEGLIDHIKSCLGSLVLAYTEFAPDMGLGEGEMREARKVAGL